VTRSVRDRGGVLLLSCYELGHPPHGLALTAGFLARAGFDPVARDLAVDRLDADEVRAARVVAISVPMHTALRLGLAVAARVRALSPDCRLCFFGLYAPLNEELLRARGADWVLGGEHEAELVALCEQLDSGQPARAVASAAPLARLEFPAPRRQDQAPLERYAKLAVGRRRALAGYTEASRGCLHMCAHCPIPPVYGGRLFVVPVDTVVADVAAQVAAGAEHITFGDPDFFNGPRHALAVLRAMRARWPPLSFDVTIKVSHLLRHHAHLGELTELGCAFVVTAVESLDDAVLARLDKGHTRADVEQALALARAAGLVLRPTFVPFTPWTTLDGLVGLVDFIDREELGGCVDPVQLSIRLLVPPGSLLLALPDAARWFGPLDAASLTHTWHSEDPPVDALWRQIAATVERASERGDAPQDTLDEIRRLVHVAAGRPAPPPRRRAHDAPRLTESWFC
jgi:radical SAM superfamily enzyme YgiQ (UPF0313 family)